MVKGDVCVGGSELFILSLKTSIQPFYLCGLSLNERCLFSLSGFSHRAGLLAIKSLRFLQKLVLQFSSTVKFSYGTLQSAAVCYTSTWSLQFCINQCSGGFCAARSGWVVSTHAGRAQKPLGLFYTPVPGLLRSSGGWKTSPA